MTGIQHDKIMQYVRSTCVSFWMRRKVTKSSKKNWVELDGLPSTVICLRLSWPSPFDLISVFQAQVHTWLNFAENSSKIYEDIVFTMFSGSLPAVTLTFDLWPQKLIRITNPDTPVAKIAWKFLHWYVRYSVHKVFELLPAVTLTFDLLT